MSLERELCKQVSFDGVNFWLDDVRVGKLPKTLIFKQLDPDVLQERKEKCIGKIMECGC